MKTLDISKAIGKKRVDALPIIASLAVEQMLKEDQQTIQVAFNDNGTIVILDIQIGYITPINLKSK